MTASVPQPVPSAMAPEPRELSALALLNIVLRHRRLIVGLPILLATIFCTLKLFEPRTWTATASFMPQTENSASRLSGLAAQFGVALPGGDAAGSPAFYADLLTSRGILQNVVETPFTATVEGRSRTAPLHEWYEIETTNDALRREESMRALRESVGVDPSRETGIVHLSVKSRWPALSEQVAARMLELLNQFNVETRRSQAAAEREFVQERLAEARTNLTQAEERLESFIEQNRRFTSSAELTFENDRLQREVRMRQEIVNALAQSYEQARIDEVRDIPVITVIEQPEQPARPDRRGLVRTGVASLFGGALLGLFIALALEAMRRSRSGNRNDVEEFAELKRAAAHDLRHPFAALRDGLRRRRA